jgi:anti-sigma factor ChrR (cupin superfamily)
LTQRVVIETAQQSWIESPSDGVQRKPLEREHQESGHTTSVVRFAPGSQFTRHVHTQGEEILVLDGVFSDELGDYPAGSYLRNPPGSAHSPFSREGCTLLVKLDQFSDGDDTRVVLDTETQPWQPGIGGLRVKPLHEFEHEHTALVYWPEGEVFQPHRHYGGEEIFVLSGTFRDEHGSYPQGSWLRNPHMSQHHPFALEETVIWVKVGHLPVPGAKEVPRLYTQRS